jgi:hypothetical protein
MAEWNNLPHGALEWDANESSAKARSEEPIYRTKLNNTFVQLYRDAREFFVPTRRRWHHSFKRHRATHRHGLSIFHKTPRRRTASRKRHRRGSEWIRVDGRLSLLVNQVNVRCEVNVEEAEPDICQMATFQ